MYSYSRYCLIFSSDWFWAFSRFFSYTFFFSLLSSVCVCSSYLLYSLCSVFLCFLFCFVLFFLPTLLTLFVLLIINHLFFISCPLLFCIPYIVLLSAFLFVLKFKCIFPHPLVYYPLPFALCVINSV